MRWRADGDTGGVGGVIVLIREGGLAPFSQTGAASISGVQLLPLPNEPFRIQSFFGVMPGIVLELEPRSVSLDRHGSLRSSPQLMRGWSTGRACKSLLNISEKENGGEPSRGILHLEHHGVISFESVIDRRFLPLLFL